MRTFLNSRPTPYNSVIGDLHSWPTSHVRGKKRRPEGHLRSFANVYANAQSHLYSIIQ